MEHRPSPNFDARPAGRTADMIVVHYTGMKTAGESLARLCDPASRVSAHYFINEDGAVTRLVLETMRAWHAGQASWQGERDINGCSIGIELQNPGHEFGTRPFPDAQIQGLIALAHAIRSRLQIPDERILGHSDVAPGRKLDPGELFPWAKLAEAGIGLWPDTIVKPVPAVGVSATSSTEEIRRLQEKLKSFGYGVEASGAYDVATRSAVLAFKRHWSPAGLDDAADAATIAILENLLEKSGSRA
jgi:N-acetylmuramoyl-L-alanine amidase